MNRKVLALSTTCLLVVVVLVLNSNRSEQGAFAEQLVAQQAQKKLARKNAAAKKAAPRQMRPAANAGGAKPNTEYVSAMVQAAHEGGAVVMSDGDSYDDWASIAQTSDGTRYIAYAAYYNGHDEVRVHRQLENGQWSTRSPMPTVRADADIWMPQLAVDASDRVWVIWAEQTGQSRGKTGNWDLYARSRETSSWGKIVRLTDDEKPDIHPHVATDSDGNIHVVWQAHPENNGDIQYCRFDGKSWSKPLAVTSDAESDWFPHVAVGSDGTVWIVFDSYRNGDYDVFLTSVKDGKLGNVIPVATSSYYEAHPSVASSADGAVWIAWEQGGHNWGKDQGYWLKQQSKDQGTSLGSTRQVKVACYRDGKLLAAPDVADAVEGSSRRIDPSAMAEIAAGADGRIWLRFRHLIRGQERRPGRYTRSWVENATYLSSDGWTPATVLPASPGRISVFSRILPTNDGGLAVAYSADARAVDNYHRPIQDTVMVAEIPRPADAPELPEMAAYVAPEPPAAIPAWNKPLEDRQVAAIRKHRVDIDGQPHQIVRGDLHRHTELSWDVGPGNDGSYLDFYRYMIDVAAMDFGGMTDHQGGGHYAYWWWLTEKAADMYYLAPRFVPLYGYERSAKFPNGHRNVFHAYRGVPVFPFQTTLDQTGVFPGIGTGALIDNDTKLLYEYLHRSGGICISHTSGTSSMGTDWRDNDPEIEAVVEIYQGARNSYETLGGPRVHPEGEPPDKAPGGFQKEGMVWNAYQKGYRLGTITSSDHGSTHISFAMVYTPENDRQAILDSIQKRHTYGATDNIILHYKANGHFMGDEFDTTENPSLAVRITGTSNIEQIDVVRNNEYVYAAEPNEPEVEFTYVDMKPNSGTNLYYLRVQQADGQVAWSSPVWINYTSQ